MRVISVVNYKGGVGKTTLTANLGSELARRGKRVLLIDADPQCSLTHCFYSPTEYQTNVRPTHTIKRWYDSFEGGTPRAGLADFIVTPREVNFAIQDGPGRLDLLPSDVLLFKLDLDLAKVAASNAFDRELFRRRRALLDALSERVFPAYDYVLIDCPPSFGLLTQTAVVASRDVLMPAKADYLSTIGLDTLYAAIYDFKHDYDEQVRKYTDRRSAPALDLGEFVVVFTMIQFMNQRPIGPNQFYIDMVKRMGIPALEAVMRENVTLFGRKNSRGVPAVLLVKRSEQIYIELMQLATEFLHRFDPSEGGVAAA